MSLFLLSNSVRSGVRLSSNVSNVFKETRACNPNNNHPLNKGDKHKNSQIQQPTRPRMVGLATSDEVRVDMDRDSVLDTDRDRVPVTEEAG